MDANSILNFVREEIELFENEKKNSKNESFVNTENSFSINKSKIEDSILSNKINCSKLQIENNSVSYKLNLKNESDYFDMIKTALRNIQELPNIYKPITFYLNKPIVFEKRIDINDEKLRYVKMKLVELLSIANGRNVRDLVVKQSSEKEEKEYQKKISQFGENISEYMEDEKNDDNDKYSLYNASFRNMITHKPNYYCIDEDDYKTIFYTDSLIRNLSFFKDCVYEEILRLTELGLIKDKNFYDDLLVFLVKDLLKIKFMSNERGKILDIQMRNLGILKERGNILEKQMRDYESYIASFAKNMIKKNVKNIKGRKYVFGSVLISGTQLLKRNILVKMLEGEGRTHGNLNECIKDLKFVFYSEEAGIIVTEIYIKKQIVMDSISYRFDELLELKRRNEIEFKIEGVCVLNVCRLIDYLNVEFIK